MKYTLTIEAETEDDLKIYMQARDWFCVVWELHDAARRFWKYSEDSEEVKKGEWLRDLIIHECQDRGIDL